MSEMSYILARIENGARIRFGIDYFGQPVVMVPRRWLPGRKKFKLLPDDLAVVEAAVKTRRRYSRRLPPAATTVRS